MKIIDLLNKIANGEDVPKKIKINNIIFEYRGDDYLYKDKGKKEYWLFSDGYTDKFEWLDSALNTEVEILEEEPYVEICGRWFTKSEYNEFAKDEEEKKIPEKLNYKYRNMYGHISQHKQSEINIIDTLNGVIDYLKSKGGE